jgi:hypothetical protein
MAVNVDVRDGEVDIRLDGWDALWALRQRLILPTSDIVSARVVPVEEAHAGRSWRLGGSLFPNVVTAGNFLFKGRPGARQFWSVYRDPDVLVIDTTLERPARIVLQHPDRNDLAWWIGERVNV